MTTYFFILFGFLGLGAIGYLLFNRWRVWGQILMVIGCVGAFSLLAHELYRNVLASAPKAPDRYHAVVAYMMADQVASEFGDKRGEILVILPSESAVKPELLDTLYEAFARVFAPFSGIAIKETTLRSAADVPKNGMVPLDAFEHAMNAAPNALAYVSLAGVPEHLERLSLFKKESVPALFVYDPTGGKSWVEPLKKRLVRRAIAPRPQPVLPKGRTIAGPPEEIFQRYFLWATPETADEIAEQLRDR